MSEAENQHVRDLPSDDAMDDLLKDKLEMQSIRREMEDIRRDIETLEKLVQAESEREARRGPDDMPDHEAAIETYNRYQAAQERIEERIVDVERRVADLEKRNGVNVLLN